MLENKNKKIMVYYSKLQAYNATTYYPSTVENKQCSLLYETSLMLLPTTLGLDRIKPTPKPQAGPLHNLKWAAQQAQHKSGKEPTLNIHTTIMPPHGLQALTTELSENWWLVTLFKVVLTRLN
jgi:hypothetical protein